MEFLLVGEQGSLSSMPSLSATNSFNSSKSFSEMSIGGTDGADNNTFDGTGPLGTAWFDDRNLDEEANLNHPSSNTTGTFLASMLKYEVNDASSGLLYVNASQKFVSVHGGTPIGEHASDDDVLAGSFDRTFSARSSDSTVTASAAR